MKLILHIYKPAICPPYADSSTLLVPRSRCIACYICPSSDSSVERSAVQCYLQILTGLI